MYYFIIFFNFSLSMHYLSFFITFSLFFLFFLFPQEFFSHIKPLVSSLSDYYFLNCIKRLRCITLLFSLIFLFLCITYHSLLLFLCSSYSFFFLKNSLAI